MSTMPPALRRQQILERIQRDGGVSVADLARDLTVSSITVHRDLEQLSSDGLVERVHGGARSMPAAGPPTAIPPTGWEQRAAAGRGAKATIAAHAAREVRSGSTIFLDSSSSCLALARQLVSEPATELTLVTNSPAIAYELVDERILVIVTPGELDQHMRLLAGRWTTDFLAGLNFELAFCSCSRRHAGRRADDVAPRAGRRHQRRQRQRGADDRADRLEQVRAGVAADDRAGARSSTRSSPTTASTSETAQEYRAAGVQLEIVKT